MAGSHLSIPPPTPRRGTHTPAQTAAAIAHYTLLHQYRTPRRRFGILHWISAGIWCAILLAFYFASTQMLNRNRAISASYSRYAASDPAETMPLRDEPVGGTPQNIPAMRYETAVGALRPIPHPPPQTVRMAELVLQPAANGSYLVEGQINGEPVVFLIDTGSSTVTIPGRLGERLHLALENGEDLSSSAEGETRIQRLTLGPIRLADVDARLDPLLSDDTVLLGMSALRELRIVQQNGNLILQKLLTGDEPDADDLTATQEARTAPAQLKRSVGECMGANKVIDARVLRCMQAG